MMLEERVDALTAMGTSMALVWNNLPVMLAWGCNRACALRAQPGHRPAGPDRRVSRAGPRNLACLARHPAIGPTTTATNCCWRAVSSRTGRAAERAERAVDPLRCLHRADRTRSGRHARRRAGAGQPFDPARDVVWRGDAPPRSSRRWTMPASTRTSTSRPPTRRTATLRELVRALAVAGLRRRPTS